jgi:hypothetical protein
MMSVFLTDIFHCEIIHNIHTDRPGHSESHSDQSCPVACICCNLPEQDYE